MCLLCPLTVLNIYLACRLFKEIKEFFEGLKKENLLERIARQDRNKSQVEEYGRLLDEAMSHFSVRVSLNVNPSTKCAEIPISRSTWN
jgi:hypothetical protein